jgi:hypothetical protein
VQVRLYDHLFTTDEPGSHGGDWEAELNPASETVLTGQPQELTIPDLVPHFTPLAPSPALFRISGCRIDASMAAPGALKLWDHFQFERLGFFVVDKDSDLATGSLVFNQVRLQHG